MRFGANIFGGHRLVVTALAALVLLSSSLPARASSSVTLGWDPGPNFAPTGYRLYYGTTSGSYNQMVDVGNVNSTTISNLGAGTTYYFAVTEYNASGTESPASAEVSFVAPRAGPTVSLASPGGTINGPANVTLTASASETGGSISKVDFYAGSTLLGEAFTSPYTIVWNNAPPGTYSLTATAYDGNGMSASSSAVSLTIVRFGITGLTRSTNGVWTLTASGAAGSTYDVYYSGDLVNWTYLQTVTNSGGTINITDEAPHTGSRCFYRLVVSANNSVSGLRTNARAR